MRVSQYACDPDVTEISSSVKVDVVSTCPTLDLSDCFRGAYIGKRHRTVTDVDKHVPFDTNFLVSIVDYVLEGMTIKTLINFDDMEYREEEGWEYALDLNDELYDLMDLFPDWQLKMAADRLRNLSQHIETKKYDWSGWQT